MHGSSASLNLSVGGHGTNLPSAFAVTKLGSVSLTNDSGVEDAALEVAHSLKLVPPSLFALGMYDRWES